MPFTLCWICATHDGLSLSILPLHRRWPIRPSDCRVGARTCGEPGLALTSATAGVLLFGALAIWAGCRVNRLPVGILPALTLIGCIYEVLCLLYWFRDPAIGVAIVTGCFAVAWILSLI